LDTSKKSDDGPDLVVPLDRDPAWHAGVFEPVLDDPEQVVRLLRAHRDRQLRRWRQHVFSYWVYRNPWRTMTKGTAAVEMGGAKSDHVRIVELRHLNAIRVPFTACRMPKSRKRSTKGQ
jgi:hypothetical protein